MKYIITLALAALAAAGPIEQRQRGGRVGSTATEFTDGGCKPIIMLFARGSTETGNMGTTVAASPLSCSSPAVRPRRVTWALCAARQRPTASRPTLAPIRLQSRGSSTPLPCLPTLATEALTVVVWPRWSASSRRPTRTVPTRCSSSAATARVLPSRIAPSRTFRRRRRTRSSPPLLLATPRTSRTIARFPTSLLRRPISFATPATLSVPAR
ncbi:cutinase 1 like protein [Verticillium longisporum]|nr:cutinase 1 like protein [Verticillium longisporum]